MHSNVSYTFNENTRLQDEQKSCKHCNLHVKGRSCSRDYLIVQCVQSLNMGEGDSVSTHIFEYNATWTCKK